MQVSNQQLAGLVRTVTRFGDALRKGQARAFDPVRVGVLQVVAEHDQIRPGAVAEELDVLPSSVTRHVQALTELGYLAVTTDPTDRRALLIEATEAGRQQLRQFLEVGTEVFGAVVADWSAEDILTLETLLNRLIDDWATTGVHQQQVARSRRRFHWSEG